MNKHTSGPWEKQKYGNSYEIFRCDKAGTYIANVNRDNPNHKANANLIAAAPELLECLQTATKIMKSGGLPVPVNFTKAIKKAKGEGINE